MEKWEMEYNQDREDAFESWWAENRTLMGKCNISKGFAKTIFSSGYSFGWDNGFDKLTY